MIVFHTLIFWAFRGARWSAVTARSTSPRLQSSISRRESSYGCKSGRLAGDEDDNAGDSGGDGGVGRDEVC